MPTLAQNIGILKNGPPKRSARGSSRDTRAYSTSAFRDHYERYELFSKKQRRAKDHKFLTGNDLLVRAIAADRDTPLGILDTIVREFIVYWIPEVELFLSEKSQSLDADKEESMSLATGLQAHVVRVARRVGCTGEADAAELRDTLLEYVQSCLSKLYERCKDVLEVEEKSLYSLESRKNVISAGCDTSVRHGSKGDAKVSEAHILNSSTLWDMADTKTLPIQLLPKRPAASSARKRRFSEARLYEESDPADNGQAWEHSGQYVKRPKFEINLRQVNFSACTDTHDAVYKSAREKSHDSNDVVLMSEREPSHIVSVVSNDSQAMLITTRESSELPIPGSFDWD